MQVIVLCLQLCVLTLKIKPVVWLFCFLNESPEKDDDYLVLYHHRNRWLLLSLQLLLINGFTQVKCQPSTLCIVCLWTSTENDSNVIFILFLGIRLTPRVKMKIKNWPKMFLCSHPSHHLYLQSIFKKETVLCLVLSPLQLLIWTYSLAV